MSLYLHIRVLLGILVGLSLRHLLVGAVQLIQHPDRHKTYWVHLVWVTFVFLYLIHFWWWEFHLETITTWTFLLYLVLIFYGLLLFLLCALLFPVDLTDYEGFKDYFYSRKKWFFGSLIAVFIIDIFDTLIKGPAYVHAIGPEYWIRIGAFLLLSLLAIKIKSELFHSIFAVSAIVYEVFYIFRLYFTLG